jgi:hypothetical protein
MKRSSEERDSSAKAVSAREGEPLERRDAASPDARKQSRRRFLGLLTAGAVAMVAAEPARAIAKTTRHRKRADAKPAARATEPRASAAIAKEIATQKKYTAKSLETVRAYPLAPGSEMAFVFRPMKAERKRSGT